MNGRSLSSLQNRRAPFTAFAGLLALLGALAPLPAAADRVVLLRPKGSLETERLDALEERLAEAIVAVGHSATTEGGSADPTAASPDSANELRAVAELQQAPYVVVPTVSFLDDSYRLRLVVGYVPNTRREVIDVLVWQAEETSRLQAILSSVLRPEGLGADKGRLELDPPRPETETNAIAAPEPTAVAPAPTSAPRVQLSPWAASAGVDLRPILRHPPARDGGVLVSFALRLTHDLAQLPGLQFRGFVEGTTGAAGGLALGGGAAYWVTPIDGVGLRFGGALELGYYQALTGDQLPSFLLRAAPVVAFDLSHQLFVEGSVAELQWLSSNDVVSLGFSARAGVRF